MERSEYNQAVSLVLQALTPLVSSQDSARREVLVVFITWSPFPVEGHIFTLLRQGVKIFCFVYSEFQSFLDISPSSCMQLSSECGVAVQLVRGVVCNAFPSDILSLCLKIVLKKVRCALVCGY